MTELQTIIIIVWIAIGLWGVVWAGGEILMFGWEDSSLAVKVTTIVVSIVLVLLTIISFV